MQLVGQMFHWGCSAVGRCRIGLLALRTAVSRAARGCRDRKKHGTFLRVSIGAREPRFLELGTGFTESCSQKFETFTMNMEFKIWLMQVTLAISEAFAYTSF